MVTDGGSRRLVTVCGGDERETTILISRGHALQLELTNPRLTRTIGAFLFKYQGKYQGTQVLKYWVFKY